VAYQIEKTPNAQPEKAHINYNDEAVDPWGKCKNCGLRIGAHTVTIYADRMAANFC